MKRLFTYLLTILAVFFLSCDKDENSEDNVSISLDVTNLTGDGYFDGLLYYKVTSNSPREVSVNKVEKSVISIEIPSTVRIEGNSYSCTIIADQVFYGCENLTSVKMPNTIRAIGKGAFSHCRKLSSITISENVSEIKEQTFEYCKISSLTLPKSVEYIGSLAFYRVWSLIDLKCKSITPPRTEEDTFVIDEVLNQRGQIKGYEYVHNNATLYIPNGSIELYRSTAPWNNFKNIVEE